MPYTIKYHIMDEKGAQSQTSVHVPSDTSWADVLAFARALAPLLEGLLTGQIVRAVIHTAINLAGLGLRKFAFSGSDCEEQAKIVFSANGYKTQQIIPTIDETVLIPHTNALDLTNPDVESWLSAMQDGLRPDVNLVEPCEPRGEDIDNLDTARGQFVNLRGFLTGRNDPRTLLVHDDFRGTGQLSAHDPAPYDLRGTTWAGQSSAFQIVGGAVDMDGPTGERACSLGPHFTDLGTHTVWVRWEAEPVSTFRFLQIVRAAVATGMLTGVCFVLRWDFTNDNVWLREYPGDINRASASGLGLEPETTYRWRLEDDGETLRGYLWDDMVLAYDSAVGYGNEYCGVGAYIGVLGTDLKLERLVTTT